MSQRRPAGLRAALTAGGAATALLLTGTATATAADLVDWEPTGIQFVNADCARNEYVVHLELTGTTDDYHGFDLVEVELWDDGELKGSDVVELEVGTTTERTVYFSFVGRYGTGVPGVGIYVNDIDATGSSVGTTLDSVDPFIPEDRDGACSFGIERVGGADRVETAALLAQRFIVADTVVVASSRAFPDALAAAPLSLQEAGPMLLTHPQRLPAPTRQEIERFEPERIIVIGGSGAVADDVLDELAAAAPGATVERIGGPDRYATSALIADQIVQDSTPEVFLATGTDFPDALVLSAMAARNSAPILLTRPGALPDATRTFLEGATYDDVWVGGGEGAVSAAVMDEATAIGSAAGYRFAGADRYETAALVLAFFPPQDRVMVATGQEFPDALTAVPVAGRTGAPVALSRPDRVPAAVVDEISRIVEGSSAPQITLVGGEGALHPSVRTQLETVLGSTADGTSRGSQGGDATSNRG